MSGHMPGAVSHFAGLDWANSLFSGAVQRGAVNTFGTREWLNHVGE